MRYLASIVLFLLLPFELTGAQGDSLDIRALDGRISIHVEAVPLGRLLGLLDRVAGTESTVPDELANRNVSVQFNELDIDRAIKKIFEGLPLDYAVLGRTRIFVTAVSQTLAGQSLSPVAASSNSTLEPFVNSQAPTPAANPFQAAGVNPAVGANAARGNAAAQPAVIQTPFGPLVNPRATANARQTGSAPLVGPGQGFPFGAVSPASSPDGSAIFGTTAGLPTGTGVPGTPAGNSQPSIFGNTSPPMLDLKQQPSTTTRPQQ